MTAAKVSPPPSPRLSTPFRQLPPDDLDFDPQYAQKIRTIGQSSKESWITKLWLHMFGNKGDSDKSDDEMDEKADDMKDAENKGNVVALPPIVSNSQHKGRETRRSDLHSRRSSSQPLEGRHSAPKQKVGQVGSGAKMHALPAELANSPYISPLQKNNVFIAPVPPSRDKPRSQSFRDSTIKREARNHDMYMKKPSHPFLSLQQDNWKPKTTRGENLVHLEKRAKLMADKAMKEAKIFCCDGPYPVDVFVRYSLRKRGWVEKFGCKANNSLFRGGTNKKLSIETDEDFDVLCAQEVPPAWEEDHGIYAMMSRVVRHYPAKFIWGGPREVNNLVLKHEVVTNHFPKARYFASKVLIVSSLRDLSWVNDSDHMAFFPRCFLLNEDEKDDIIDNYRMTTAMCVLKWVLHLYASKKQTKTTAANTKSEEVQCTQTPEEESMFAANKPQTNATNIEIVEKEEEEEEDENEENKEEEEGGEEEQCKDNSANTADCDDIRAIETDDIERGVSEVTEEECEEERTCVHFYDDIQYSRRKDPLPSGRVEYDKDGQAKVLPDLKAIKRPKKGGSVPVEIVEYAIQAIRHYISVRNHEDIDSKLFAVTLFFFNMPPKGLNSSQWDDMIKWFYKVSQDAATIPMTESLLKQSDSCLRDMKKVWPQYDLDGMRNLWIVKPGDKSKGMGIEFCDKLEELLKYVHNSTQTGNYVMQKYIERPLLIYSCKFDIRQWFLVTDWNPLTVWFYKESYLRICSQEFNYDSMHEAVHLSNVAVQQNYLNGNRDPRIPDNNFMTSSEFQEYLSNVNAGDKWDDVIYPGMKEAVVNTLLATQDIAESKKCAFELYGADFMICENFCPYLLEVNASPGMAPSSTKKAKLCYAVVDDTFKVVLDYKDDANCDTGGYELIYKDPSPQPHRCVEAKLLLEGQRIRRGELMRYHWLDQRITTENQAAEKRDIDKLNRELDKEFRCEQDEEALVAAINKALKELPPFPREKSDERKSRRENYNHIDSPQQGSSSRNESPRKLKKLERVPSIDSKQRVKILKKIYNVRDTPPPKRGSADGKNRTPRPK